SKIEMYLIEKELHSIYIWNGMSAENELICYFTDEKTNVKKDSIWFFDKFGLLFRFCYHPSEQQQI
ncbi:MAG: hypothetical protein ACW98D_20445, partial [Promethearchaeota archaeon]